MVAVIRRMPGGVFVKGPRSHLTATMPAIPISTTTVNLSTYFDSWPKRQAAFLMYGTFRACSTNTDAMHPDPRPPPKPTSSSGAPSVGAHGEELLENLYGGGGGISGSGERAAGACGASGGPAGLAAAAPAPPKALGLAGVLRRFRKGQRLAMVTAYDAPSAKFAGGAGVELVLVGDSLGNCRLGLADTVGVTMEDMLRATAAVRRGLDAHGLTHPKPVLVGDMPFGSYLSEADCLRNAAALRIAGADLVKLEGGAEAAAHFARALTRAGIPVMAHVGLEPQRAALQGGLRLQGTTAESALAIVQDARALVEAGSVAVVVECVPAEVGRAIQAAVPTAPVIGIGAGGGMAGQVLVCDDLVGLHGKPPSFAKRYADLAAASKAAYDAYVAEVRSGAFPGEAHSRHMKPEELANLSTLLQEVGVDPAAAVLPTAGVDPEAAASPAPGEDPVAAPSPAVGADPVAAASPAASRLALSRFAVPRPVPLAASACMSSAASVTDVEVLSTREAVHEWRRAAAAAGRRVALVPTMGNLHEGHLELVDEARRQADDVLVSIFVNPAQFAPHEDFGRYPRTLDQDVALLRQRGVAAAFAPTPDVLYPGGSPGGHVVVPRFVQGLSEDASRPGFFTGVATVCLKLFNICEPDVVVFGQKDAMQCAVIAGMLQDLCLHRVKLVVAPTSREADGLARSSRNAYLTPAMRQKAPAIYKALVGETGAGGASPGTVRFGVRSRLEAEGMEVEYVSVADRQRMAERADDGPLADSVVSIACRLQDCGQTCRLIDNVVVG